MRLYGIDTPQMPGACRAGRACTSGDPSAARDHLKNLTTGKLVECRAPGADRYRRKVVGALPRVSTSPAPWCVTDTPSNNMADSNVEVVSDEFRLPIAASTCTMPLKGGAAMKLVRISFAFVVMTWSVNASAHGGGLNSEGCHTNRKTGDYHCHRSGSASPPARSFGILNSSTGSSPFPNCSAARAAGAAPVYAGTPGYGPWLDRDHDGVGCE